MSDFEYTEGLIARYTILQRRDEGLSDKEALEFLAISIFLHKRGFTLTEDNVDWLPPFTPDAGRLALDER